MQAASCLQKALICGTLKRQKKDKNKVTFFVLVMDSNQQNSKFLLTNFHDSLPESKFLLTNFIEN